MARTAFRVARFVGLFSCTLLLAAAAGAESETVSLRSADGHEIAGTLWPNEDGPGILLLHQCNSSRAMYEELGGKLAEAGFKVLAIDFRGFGDSKGNGLDLSSADREVWQQAMAGFPQDAEAAYSFLAGRGSGEVTGALGASCGGWQLPGLAAEHGELARLGFFSSGLKAVHERDLLQMTAPRYLFIAAKGDISAARPAGTILYRGGKERSEVLLYEGDAHGYPLFEQDPELADKIVSFYMPLLD